MARRKPKPGLPFKSDGDISHWVESIVSMSCNGSMCIEPRKLFDTALVGVDSKGSLVYSKDKVVRCVMASVVQDAPLAEKYYRECILPSINELDNAKAPLIIENAPPA